VTRAVLCLCVALSFGCTGTSLRSGAPPGKTAAGYRKRWHGAFLFGAVRTQADYRLSQICPSGWAEVRIGPDEFTILASLLTLFVYSPSRVTIVCAAAEGAGPPAVRDLSTDPQMP
jgi:hypothetical protein